MRKGRAEFLAQFPSIATPAIQARLADPGARETFERCKLDFSERERHAAEYALHQDLLRLRREDSVFNVGRVDGAVLGAEAFVLRYFAHDGADRLLLVNLGRDLLLDVAPEPLLAPPQECVWTIAWSSEDASIRRQRNGAGGARRRMACAGECGGRARTRARLNRPRSVFMSAEQDRRKTGAYAWWQRGIIYQVYPRSFQDSNGDGIGDLRGITQRLDYLRWLGIDGVWISPIYPSPMKDFGYDVADYCGIHPQFGTLEDFDDLIREAHGRGLKVILDFVPNHTSDQHPWFLESRSSRSNPKRDWYIWRDPARDGGPPNNWLSNFGGSGWQFDEGTRQYYYHAFLPEQPDLNWRNPEVIEAMLGVLRFWLERGVNGFRVDVIWHLMKDAEFRDNPPNPTWTPDGNPFHEFLPVYTSDRPEVHDVIARMRRLFDEYDERVLIGEIYLPIERLVHYYGEDLSGAHLPFNFQLLLAPWDARHIGQLIQEYEAAVASRGLAQLGARQS